MGDRFNARFCAECGTERDGPLARFCATCGHRFPEIPTSVQPTRESAVSNPAITVPHTGPQTTPGPARADLGPTQDRSVERIRLIGWIAFYLPLGASMAIAGLAILAYSLDVGLLATTLRALAWMAILAALCFAAAFARSPNDTRRGLAIGLLTIFGISIAFGLTAALSALVYIRYEGLSSAVVALTLVGVAGLVLLAGSLTRGRAPVRRNSLMLLAMLLLVVTSVVFVAAAYVRLTAGNGPGYRTWIGGAILLGALMLGLLVFAALAGNEWTAVLIASLATLFGLISVANKATAVTVALLICAAAALIAGLLSLSVTWSTMDQRLERVAQRRSRHDSASVVLTRVCEQCGAEPIESDDFCRQCGSQRMQAVPQTDGPSDMATDREGSGSPGNWGLVLVAGSLLAVFCVAGLVGAVESAVADGAPPSTSTPAPGLPSAPATSDPGDTTPISDGTRYFVKGDAKDWYVMVMRVAGTAVVAETEGGPVLTDRGACFEGEIVGESIDGVMVGNYGHSESIPFAKVGDGVVLRGQYSGMRPASESEVRRLLALSGLKPFDVDHCVGIAERARTEGLMADG